MSTLTVERTVLPEVHPHPEVHPREVVRCRRCQIVQYRTLNELCRKCDFPLPPPPRPELRPPGTDSGPARAAGHHEGLHSRAKTARELTIGRKLRELRDQQNLTQQDMAGKAGVPRTYISRIENARLLPGPVMLRRIAEALQVDILDLLPNKNRGLNGMSSAGQDAFWAGLSGYFTQLKPEAMAAVLEHVRALASGSAARDCSAEAVMAAR